MKNPMTEDEAFAIGFWQGIRAIPWLLIILVLIVAVRELLWR